MFLTPDHYCHALCSKHPRASEEGGVEHLNPLFAQIGGQCLRHEWVGSGQIDQDQTFPPGLEEIERFLHDLINHIGIGQR